MRASTWVDLAVRSCCCPGLRNLYGKHDFTEEPHSNRRRSCYRTVRAPGLHGHVSRDYGREPLEPAGVGKRVGSIPPGRLAPLDSETVGTPASKLHRFARQHAANLAPEGPLARCACSSGHSWSVSTS